MCVSVLRKMCVHVCIPEALALSSVRSGVCVWGVSSRNTLSYGESRESRGGDWGESLLQGKCTITSSSRIRLGP